MGPGGTALGPALDEAAGSALQKADMMMNAEHEKQHCQRAKMVLAQHGRQHYQRPNVELGTEMQRWQRPIVTLDSSHGCSAVLHEMQQFHGAMYLGCCLLPW